MNKQYYRQSKYITIVSTARDNSSAIIEVRLRPPIAQWRYRLDVFADGRRVFFDRPSFRTQHFPRKI